MSFTRQLGWEVRLLVGAQLEIVQTQVCRDQADVLMTGEQWKQAMIDKGWSDGSVMMSRSAGADR